MKKLLFDLFGKTLLNTLGCVLGYQEEENKLKMMAAEMEKQKKAKNQQQN